MTIFLSEHDAARLDLDGAAIDAAVERIRESVRTYDISAKYDARRAARGD